MSKASCSTPRQPCINTVLFTLWRVFTFEKSIRLKLLLSIYGFASSFKGVTALQYNAT